MIKNRTAQLVYLSMATAIGIIGVIASFGLFSYTFRWDFYIHFTNLSNYLCVGILIAELVQTIKKKEDSYVSTSPLLKFMGLLSIVLTFFVFNIMLAPTREAYLNFTINSTTFHIIIPIIYVVDWFLFYERKKVTWKYPLYSIVVPLIYVIFVFIHAWILGFDASIPNFNGNGSFIYPYFFLNIETQGVGGVLKWIAILAIAFVAVGYIFYGLNHITKKQKSKNQKDAQ